MLIYFKITVLSYHLIRLASILYKFDSFCENEPRARAGEKGTGSPTLVLMNTQDYISLTRIKKMSFSISHKTQGLRDSLNPRF